jgi:hypothetical protein
MIICQYTILAIHIYLTCRFAYRKASENPLDTDNLASLAIFCIILFGGIFGLLYGAGCFTLIFR